MNLIAVNYKLLKNALGPVLTPGYDKNKYARRILKAPNNSW